MKINFLYVQLILFYFIIHVMDQIDIKLNIIIEKLNLLEQKIEALDKKINDCEKSCQNMDDHIHFVKNTYTSLRTPLDFIRTKINMLAGNESTPLPEITNE